jgi:RNA polymerase sigma factor (sigma-70 family)
MAATFLSNDASATRTTQRPIKFIFHESFRKKEAESKYGALPVLDDAAIEATYMPDDVTRDLAQRMHYAGWRASTTMRQGEATRWSRRYFELRDKIVVGNRKLVYRAVRRRMAQSNRTEDLIGDCHIVLIQAVAAYNPWLGIRFSTYAFTCLVRALSRLSQRQGNDWLSRALSIDLAPEAERHNTPDDPSWIGMPRIDDYLREEHPLLTSREKAIIARRFQLIETTAGHTLEEVGRAMGLSKERVRQVQASALGKLRAVLKGNDTTA